MIKIITMMQHPISVGTGKAEAFRGPYSKIELVAEKIVSFSLSPKTCRGIDYKLTRATVTWTIYSHDIF